MVFSLGSCVKDRFYRVDSENQVILKYSISFVVELDMAAIDDQDLLDYEEEETAEPQKNGAPTDDAKKGVKVELNLSCIH